MNTEIEFSPSYSLLTVGLDPGETVTAEPGAMVAQQGVELRTGVSGGIRRVFGGESFFINHFMGGPEGGWVMLAPPFPGDIRERYLLPGEELFIESGAFLAGWGPLEFNSRFQGFRSLMSGEGSFFLQVSVSDAPGTVFFNAYGAVREVVLEPGRELAVDTGHLVGFTGGVDYSIGKVGNIRSLIAGGEGLVMKLNGSGSVWVQTRNLVSLSRWMSSFLKKRKSD